jgi:hypothetical protein
MPDCLIGGVLATDINGERLLVGSTGTGFRPVSVEQTLDPLGGGDTTRAARGRGI